MRQKNYSSYKVNTYACKIKQNLVQTFFFQFNFLKLQKYFQFFCLQNKIK